MRTGTRHRAAALVAGVLAAAGCGSYRRIAPLDDAERAEVGRLRERLAGRRVYVGRGEHRVGDTDPVAYALGTLGLELAHAPGPATAEVETSGFYGICMNPVLGSALTLGILPSTMPPRTRCTFRIVDADGRETTRPFELEDSTTFGWLALPFGLLPGRSAFFFSEDTDDDQVKARNARIALFLGRELAEPIR
jgi:hypothetical protein